MDDDDSSRKQHSNVVTGAEMVEAIVNPSIGTLRVF